MSYQAGQVFEIKDPKNFADLETRSTRPIVGASGWPSCGHGGENDLIPGSTYKVIEIDKDGDVKGKIYSSNGEEVFGSFFISPNAFDNYCALGLFVLAGSDSAEAGEQDNKDRATCFKCGRPTAELPMFRWNARWCPRCKI